MKLWDPSSGRETLTLELETDAVAVKWRPDGKALAAVSAAGGVRFWSAAGE